MSDDPFASGNVPGFFLPLDTGGPGCRNWLEGQYRASFKGVGFEVDAEAREGGRRIVPHQYASRETWDNEDLGRRINPVKVRAYVHGNDADVQAETLFEACNSYGSGTLSLPFVPPVQADCAVATRVFRADELGRFFFDLEFILRQPVRGIRAETPTQMASSVSAAAAEARTVLQQQFDRSYNAVSIPSVARDAAATMLTEASGAFGEAATAVRMTDAAGAQVRYEISQLSNRALIIAYSGQRSARSTPLAYFGDQLSIDSGLSGALVSIVTRIGDAGIATPEAAVDATEAMLDLGVFTRKVVSDMSMARSVVSERFLTELIAALIRALALCQAARAAVTRSYRSRSEAVQMRSRIGNAFNAEIDKTDNPDIAAALDRVRVAAIAYLSRSGAELPRVLKIRIRTFRPAAVISHIAYGDAKRDREVVERNGVPHPLFARGDIEVLAQT